MPSCRRNKLGLVQLPTQPDLSGGLNITGETWDAKSPVSYTHLDVYKRQVQGEVTHFVATFLDLTERKAAEESINRLAYYDPLTQLPNRRLLLDRLAGVQAAARRESPVSYTHLDVYKRQ